MIQPLRITARMAEPVITMDSHMHFDGILAYGAYQALPRAEKEALPPLPGAEWAIDFDLPLERWERPAAVLPGIHPRLIECGTIWGWKASAACARWLSHGHHEVRKKPALDEMARLTRDNRVQINCMRFKAAGKRYPTMWAPIIRWYAVGDAEEVAHLLSFVFGVGKLCGHGMGHLCMRDDGMPDWTVEPWPHDWSCYAEIDGQQRPTRRMPADEQWHRADGIRAPYHHSSRRYPCVQPDRSICFPEGE